MPRLIAFGIFVAFLLRAQDPLKSLPKNYRLLCENQMVRVIRVHYGPHERLPVHDHPSKPTVYVYLTDSGPVRFSHIGEQGFSLVRQPEKAGTFRISPGRLEKHEVENAGDIATDFLRIELSQMPLGFLKAFRSVRTFDPARSGVSKEFSNSSFRIERLIAAGTRPLTAQDVEKPSLLVAFSVITLRMDSAPNATVLHQGDVYWMNPGTRVAIAGAPGTPGHLLRIVFQ